MSKEDEIEILKLKQIQKLEIMEAQVRQSEVEHQLKMERLNKMKEIAEAGGIRGTVNGD